MEHLPRAVRELFWEGLHEEPDPDRHAEYIAVRVLEHGDEAAVRWLIERYGRERVRATARSGRLRPAQARFWGAVLADGRELRPG